MSACIFCKIASGEVRSQKVYEDDEVLAFKDLNAQAPVHLLVIPKRHIASLAASTADDEALLGRLQSTVRAVAAQEGLSSFRVVANNGREAGQSVDHLHYHVLGGRRLGWPPG
ncbi:MAG: histidine triad nucleotide-binding protein [Elusimicrobiota bacterium]|jgi:histidine triad (HIT) family protein